MCSKLWVFFPTCLEHAKIQTHTGIRKSEYLHNVHCIAFCKVEKIHRWHWISCPARSKCFAAKRLDSRRLSTAPLGPRALNTPPSWDLGGSARFMGQLDLVVVAPCPPVADWYTELGGGVDLKVSKFSQSCLQANESCPKVVSQLSRRLTQSWEEKSFCRRWGDDQLACADCWLRIQRSSLHLLCQIENALLSWGPSNPLLLLRFRQFVSILRRSDSFVTGAQLLFHRCLNWQGRRTCRVNS